MIRLFAILLAFALSATPLLVQHAQAQEEPDAGRAERRELLVRHGIDVAPGPLISLLTKGFPENLPQGLPERPFKKAEVLNAAVIELGIQRVEAAVPVLQKLARRESLAGVDRIIALDLEGVPMEARETTYNNLRRFFSINALTALGWIGDPAAEATILEVMRSESGSAFTTKGALALGQLGSSQGIGGLVLLAQQHESLDCIAAFEAVWIVTGRNYAVSEWTSLAKRRELATQLKQWFEAGGADEPVYRNDVIRRMRTGASKDSTTPGSLRHLLRASRDVLNYDRRYAAREQLKTAVGGRFDELLTISRDKMEDVDIRLAAMQYLAALNPRSARKHIARLEKDENQPIAEMAKSLEKDIKEAIDAAKKR